MIELHPVWFFSLAKVMTTMKNNDNNDNKDNDDNNVNDGYRDDTS